MTPLLLLSVSLAAPVPKELADKPPTAETVADALRARYPVLRSRLAGVFVLNPKAKVVELKTPALVRADSGLRLFRTTLDSGHFEYLDVETLVLAWTDKGAVKTVEFLSPDYTDTTGVLAARLKGLVGKTAAEREALATEIAGLIASVTHKGEIHAAKLTGDTFTAELWQALGRGRQIRITFDAKGALSDLELADPDKIGR